MNHPAFSSTVRHVLSTMPSAMPSAGFNLELQIQRPVVQVHSSVFWPNTHNGWTVLAARCPVPNIDITILACVISTADGRKYPQVNFGAACRSQITEMATNAPGLLSCSRLATDISAYQSKYGKKVMLSIGGATSQISFASPSPASTFAIMTRNMFRSPSSSVDIGLRPFGTVQIDGFDVGAYCPTRKRNSIPANQPLLIDNEEDSTETITTLPPPYASMIPPQTRPTTTPPLPNVPSPTNQTRNSIASLRLRLGTILQQPWMPDPRRISIH